MAGPHPRARRVRHRASPRDRSAGALLGNDRRSHRTLDPWSRARAALAACGHGLGSEKERPWLCRAGECETVSRRVRRGFRRDTASPAPALRCDEPFVMMRLAWISLTAISTFNRI